MYTTQTKHNIFASGFVGVVTPLRTFETEFKTFNLINKNVIRKCFMRILEMELVKQDGENKSCDKADFLVDTRFSHINEPVL